MGVLCHHFLVFNSRKQFTLQLPNIVQDSGMSLSTLILKHLAFQRFSNTISAENNDASRTKNVRWTVVSKTIKFTQKIQNNRENYQVTCHIIYQILINRYAITPNIWNYNYQRHGLLITNSGIKAANELTENDDTAPRPTNVFMFGAPLRKLFRPSRISPRPGPSNVNKDKDR